MLDLDALPYVPAVHKRARDHMPPTLIVLHDGETNEGSTAAEGMAAFFASGNTTGSAHVCVDDNSGVRCAPDTDRTNGAGGVNNIGLHIEQAGRASQTVKDWSDDYSTKTIANAASIARQWCEKYAIPKRFLDAKALAAGELSGITTHREVTLAGFPDNDGHSDPGPYYPIAQFMALLGAPLDQPEDYPMIFHATIDGTAADPTKANTTWYLCTVGVGREIVSGTSVAKSTLPRLAVAETIFNSTIKTLCSPAFLGRAA